MLYLVVYLFDIYQGILVITLTATLALLMGAVILKGETIGLSTGEPKRALYHKLSMRFVKFGVATLMLFTLLPSKQGLAMLGGVYVGTQIYESVDKSALTQKAIKVLNQELDGYLDSMLNKKENKDYGEK